uniref:Ferredoxin n=1 Tax=candidate division WWE3 bacterium TaxID=2053526 RepID=A0A7C4XH20_UNCKA
MERKIHSIKVSRKDCISAGTCVTITPDIFELDKDGIAVVRSNYADVSDDIIFIAAQSCPTQAIALFDKEGNQIFPIKK